MNCARSVVLVFVVGDHNVPLWFVPIHRLGNAEFSIGYVPVRSSFGTKENQFTFVLIHCMFSRRRNETLTRLTQVLPAEIELLGMINTLESVADPTCATKEKIAVAKRFIAFDSKSEIQPAQAKGEQADNPDRCSFSTQ